MQFALAHHRVGKIQAVELYLAWTIVCNVVRLASHLLQQVDELVVKWAVWNKLQSADGVGDSFEEVALSVGEVIQESTK